MLTQASLTTAGVGPHKVKANHKLITMSYPILYSQISKFVFIVDHRRTGATFVTLKTFSLDRAFQ